MKDHLLDISKGILVPPKIEVLTVTIEDNFLHTIEYLSSKFKQGDWKVFKNN